jgi:hypothetical protein
MTRADIVDGRNTHAGVSVLARVIETLGMIGDMSWDEWCDLP